MGQLERGLNRIYGIEQDRPTVRKYSRAVVMAVSVGFLSVIAFTMIAFGTAIGGSVRGSTFGHVWRVVRWPCALVLVTVAMALLFRYAPRRHQPKLGWLEFGAGISTLSWLLVTVALSGFFTLSKSFGKTYGPLAGIVAVLLWSLLSAVAILYGAAVAAQLEAVRAGAHHPKDHRKAERGAGRRRPVHARAS
jgi:YihY family inner membrane protein